MIEIDGSVYEGGGQTVRIGVALSVITNRAATIRNVRAGRPKPGLSNQHLAGINLVNVMTEGAVTDLNMKNPQIGTEALVIQPKITSVDRREFEIDAKTAGSISLIAQIALPILIYRGHIGSDIKLSIKGGTDADFAPPVKIQKFVFTNLLKKFEINIEVEEKRNGFFPIGKGHTIYRAVPVEKSISFEMERNKKKVDIDCQSWYSVDNRTQNREQEIIANLKQAQQVINAFGHEKINKKYEQIKKEKIPGVGVGAGIYLRIREQSNSDYFASLTSALKFKGKSNNIVANGEELGKTLVHELDEYLGSTDAPALDRHHSDQVLIYAALSHGKSTFLISSEKGKSPSHVMTAIYVIEKFFGEIFHLDNNVLTVHGIGFINS